MKFVRRKRRHASVEASALSDILFFLMLFFLMVSTLASSEAMKILLPKAQSSVDIPKHTIYVTIDSDRRYYINKRESNLNDIKSALSKEAVGKATVVLRADKSVPMEEFISFADVVNQLKIPMVVATEKK
jgi:biopolymer transport protein ExbD